MKAREYQFKIAVGPLLLLFLTIGYGAGCRTDVDQADLLTELSAISATLNALSANPAAKETELVHAKLLTQLEAVSNKLTILVGDRDAARAELTRIQEQLTPDDDAAIQKLAATYREFRETLPTFLAIELSPELAATDWLLRAHLHLSSEWDADAILEAEEMLEQVPLSVSQSAVDHLAEKLAGKTVGVARRHVTDETPADADAISIIIDSLNRLTPVTIDPPDELNQIRDSLASRMARLEQERVAAELTAEAANTQELISVARQISDLELRWLAFNQLNQTIDAIRLQHAVQGRELPAVFTSAQEQLRAEVSKTQRDLAKKQQDLQDQARRQYQAWALGEIEKMKPFLDKTQREAELYRLRDIDTKSSAPVTIIWADFEGVRKQFEDGIGTLRADRRLTKEQAAKVGKFVRDNWHQLAYQVQHDAAARHLLHINQNLLDPPVAKFYSEAFESTWQQIADGSDLQLSLAQRSATFSQTFA